MSDFSQQRANQPGTERLARAARAARELSETVWDFLQEQIAGPDPGRAQVLAERLAEVSATVATLIEAQAREAEGLAREWGVSVGEGADGDARDRPETAAGATTCDPRAEPSPAPHAGVEPGLAARVGVESSPTAHAATERRKPPEPVPLPPGVRLVDEQAPTATVTPFASRAQAPAPSSSTSSTARAEAEIEIRDVRRDEGPSAWISSVGRMLSRYGQDGLPFAVLLVEIVDVAHLERSETPHDLHGIVAQVESALGRGMRSTDELSRETLGRYWMLAPETNGTGARMLAERLARLVRGSATHRGVPMEVAIGIAVCPDDGTEAPALAARADLGVYSARATGRSVAHTEPPPVG